MEMAEYRDDGVWEVVPSRAHPWERDGPALDRRWRHRPRKPRAHRGPAANIPAPRPRLVGWSLLCVGGSNAGMLAVILFVGMTPIGLVACAALALSSWLLVLAELLSLRRLYGQRER